MVVLEGHGMKKGRSALLCIVQSQRKTGSSNFLMSGSSISRYSYKLDAENYEDFCRVKIMFRHPHLELNDSPDVDGRP
jgi:hypothetical protein